MDRHLTGTLVCICRPMRRRMTIADLERRLAESETRHCLLVESWVQAEWETDAEASLPNSLSWHAHTGQTLEEWLCFGWADAIFPTTGPVPSGNGANRSQPTGAPRPVGALVVLRAST